MANNDRKTLPWKEAWRINKRALKLFHDKYPKMFRSQILDTIWKALSPYIGIGLSARIIEELSAGRDPGKLSRLVLLTLACAALTMLVTALLDRYKSIESAGMFYKTNQFNAKKMLDMDFCIADDPKTHELLSTIRQNHQGGGWGVETVIYHFNQLLSAVFTLLGGVALTFSLFSNRVPEGESLAFLNNPLSLAVIVAAMLAVTYLAPAIANRGERYWALYADTQNLGNRLWSHFLTRGARTEFATDMRIYRQDIICDNYAKDKTTTFASKGAYAKLAIGPLGLHQALSGAVSVIFTGVVYVFVCMKAWAGAFGIGMITQYISSLTRLSGGVSSLIRTAGKMRNNAAFMKLTFRYLDIPNVMYQGSLTTEKRNDRRYEVEFRDVSFQYPGSSQYALRHVNMKFKVGQRLAVVGQNGSGKTTFIKLLCRLYDPTEGIILLNGIDIRKYDYQDYISIFSVVFQDFALTHFTLGQNVAAKVDYDKALAESCLEKAGFGDRLRELPHGTDTYLSKTLDENAVEMSGGERQKIALARALYKDAAFIVLDEPTAALDPVAEAEIYSKFNEIIEDKTAIYISHRLSSCRFCDNILVFDQGCMVQQGGHDTLVADKDGKYHELWYAQAQYYTNKE